MSDNQQSMSSLWESSLLSGGSSSYLEALYEQYLEDPSRVPDKWRSYFDNLPKNQTLNGEEALHSTIQAQFAALAKQPVKASAGQTDLNLEHERKQVRVLQMITGFRTRGHQNACLDPLNLYERPYIPDLDLAYYALSKDDFNLEFNTGSLVGLSRAKLGEIYNALQTTYCGSIGAEYMHITDTNERRWIQHRLEGVRASSLFPKETKINILKKLTAGEGIERYLHTKYVGQKRFSLEGGESLIPLLDELIQRAGSQGIREIGIGMAHRGRLNVLVNTLGKIPRELFEEFEGKHKHEGTGSGDVKYHQGFSSDVRTPGGDVHLALAFNPSHLEIVSPVVAGSVRARQDRRLDKARKQVLAISIHGDSAFTGQGVVMETFNMSQARGYQIGGTLHLIINNQIGFTTSNPLDTRSTLYCTDVAKMVQAPIFHVNADDAEAVLLVGQIALDYKITFQKDVVIDLVCYRRHGHNEADEPSGTQPLMYQVIRSHPTTRTLYAQKLVQEGVITEDQEKQMAADYRERLLADKPVVEELQPTCTNEFAVDWRPYINHEWTVAGDTTYDKAKLQQLMMHLATVPEHFVLQQQIKKVVEDRAKMANGELPFDWGAAENLAYATLLTQEMSVRLSGQDCCRGTFSHRHAVFHDQKTDELYLPLRNIADTKTDFLVIDSVLSEEAVLAFEYGFASAEPRTLTIWEAQFGDFANGAQVVIDQFISSGEAKWGRLCGLMMLLPHGYEGQGPEHSSARLERYLQLCAEHNMQICVPTTPAQNYHMIRRQGIRPYRKPLVVMSPKSLLRHKLAVSTLEELAQGQFYPVIGEIDEINPKKVRRVVLCCGKVYYDLLSKRREAQIDDIAIIRVEQLYPFPREELMAILAAYSHVTDIVWCQEEPRNQGAWYCSLHHFNACVEEHQKVRFVGREASAAPAVGNAALHMKQQTQLVNEALA